MDDSKKTAAAEAASAAAAIKTTRSTAVVDFSTFISLDDFQQQGRNLYESPIPSDASIVLCRTI